MDLASIKQLELPPIVAAVSAGRPHQIAKHHGEHGTVAGGELAGHVDDELGQLIAASPLGTRSQGACARAAISTARRARTLVVHAELPCRVAQPTRGRRGVVIGTKG